MWDCKGLSERTRTIFESKDGETQNLLPPRAGTKKGENIKSLQYISNQLKYKLVNKL